MCAWRICRNITHTRANLIKRHLKVDDGYVICNGKGESALHLIRDCPFVACVWMASPLGSPPKGHIVTAMDDWAMLLASSLKQPDFDICLII